MARTRRQTQVAAAAGPSRPNARASLDTRIDQQYLMLGQLAKRVDVLERIVAARQGEAFNEACGPKRGK